MRSFLLLFAFCTLLSCGKKQERVPSDVLPKEEMTALLKELYISQAAVNTFETVDSTRFTLNDYTAYVLDKRHIGKDAYLRSIRYYSEHPEQMQQIYQSVIQELSRMQSETQNAK